MLRAEIPQHQASAASSELEVLDQREPLSQAWCQSEQRQGRREWDQNQVTGASRWVELDYQPAVFNTKQFEMGHCKVELEAQRAK